RRVAGGHDPGHDRGRREPVEQPPGAGVSGSPVSRLGWYARRIARMSPAEMAWRARDKAVQAAWTRRQVRSVQALAGPPSPGVPRFSSVLPAGAAAQGTEQAPAALVDAAGRAADGGWGDAGG